MPAQNGCSPFACRVRDQLNDNIVLAAAMRRARVLIISASMVQILAAHTASLMTPSTDPFK